MKKFLLSIMEAIILILLISSIVVAGIWAAIVRAALDTELAYGIAYLASIVVMLGTVVFLSIRNND